jgi:glyoxylase-like metal-dependent hydrolase (beta-lactamase superfamily II)
VYVHQLGAPHLIDPERLVASAARLYGGEDGLRRLWGEVIPVPEDNLRVLSGGETVLGFKVEYTPGHASHHVCYLHEETATAFVGDMAGVRVPPAALTLAPTPPPDVDVGAWDRAIDVIAGWEPQTLALTHFGVADDPPTQLAAVHEALHHQVRLADHHDLAGFRAAMHRHVLERAPEADVPAFEQAAPLDHLFLGLDRWRKKHG